MKDILSTVLVTLLAWLIYSSVIYCLITILYKPITIYETLVLGSCYYFIDWKYRG